MLNKTAKARPALVRTIHAIATRQGMAEDEYREFLLGGWGSTSSVDLTIPQLREVLALLRQKQKKETSDDVSKWRKRVIAAGCEFARFMKRPDTVDYAKAIACRMAHTPSFNAIPLDRLRSVYNALRNRANDLKEAAQVQTSEELLSTINPN